MSSGVGSTTLAEPLDGEAVATIGEGRPGWFDRERIAYFRDVTFHLVHRELALRHRGSLLGWLWSFSPALLQLLVTQFLFTRVIPLGVANYPVFLLAGILAWNWFAGGVRSATGVLEVSRHLVLRPGFPTMLLPLVATLVDLVDYLIALPILFAALALTTGISADAALLPLFIVLQFFLIAGVGLMLAPLQLYFRDVRQFVGMAVTLGFWLTPVFYRQRQVPEAFKPLYDVNPMAHLIEAERGILLAGTLPSLASVVTFAVTAIVVFACGSAIFSALKDSLPEKL
jgi:ABC-type polysaccharide/polyol phosphate export permease